MVDLLSSQTQFGVLYDYFKNITFVNQLAIVLRDLTTTRLMLIDCADYRVWYPGLLLETKDYSLNSK